MPSGPFAHVCMVVRDLDQAIADWTKILRVLDPQSLEKPIVKYDEFSSGDDAGMRWATFVNEYSTEIQFIQPAPGTPLGNRLLAGSVEIGTKPLARTGPLRPLSLHLFSGAGTLRGSSTTSRKGFLADAGVGFTYDVPALQALGRWTAQSDVLSSLRFVLKLPVWVSHPEHIADDEDAFGFRWVIGISTGS